MLKSIALAAALTSIATPLVAATFGTVVPIAGHSSDIALDESRGLLYIANFAANRIEVMSTADYTIHTSFNVAAQPGALSLSPDGQFLLIAHFGNLATPNPSQNVVTLINLNSNATQTFVTGDTPLGVAFVLDNRTGSQSPSGLAVIVTTTSLFLFDPMTGVMNPLATFANLAKTLPVPQATFPSQIILAALSTSPDLRFLYGVGDNGTAQSFFRYDVIQNVVNAIGIVASPKPLPRLSVYKDGSWAMLGQYRLDLNFNNTAQFPNSMTAPEIGGNAIDSNAGIMYAQILTQAPSSGTTSGSGSGSGSGTGTGTGTTPPPAAVPPVMNILAADNLTVLDSISLPENITGRAVLDSSAKMLYAASDSGVLVLPVGSLNQYHRVNATQPDVLVSGSFCNRNIITQSLTITDPGGGNTDFAISANASGVTISPSSGRTPATVQIRIDPNSFQGVTGTTAVPLTISSASAVNIPRPVRLLVNNRDVDQRGTVVNVPGTLSDILADPVRSRFYVLQQDVNQVQVFDGGTFQQIATLRTSTTPTQMAITFDNQYLVVGHDNSQLAFVWNLDSLQQMPPIVMPPGHYPRSVAASGKALLIMSRNVTALGGPGVIDRVDLSMHTASYLPSLGIYTNNLNVQTVLTSSPNGSNILIASPDGNVMLYDANADTFTVSRQDLPSLGGAYAASSYSSYLIGNNLFNASLVPSGTLESVTGASSGFAFIDQTGYRTTASASANPGVIEHINPTQLSNNPKATKMAEAPLVPAQGGIAAFTRTLAPLNDRSAIIALSISGFTVLPWAYDAAVAPPTIAAVVNAADGTQPVAPGGLISVYGQQMSPVNMATNQIPLPTALGESCLTINGTPVPMLFVSSQQINGQIPFSAIGNSTMTLRTPGGISNNLYFTILPAAPSVFRSGTAGPQTGLATIIRADDGQLVTPTNPIHPNDTLIIYATGLGATSPVIASGMPAPDGVLPTAVIQPTLTLGGMPLNVEYAGLAPGYIGVYQINAKVPFGVPQGLSIPLMISQGSATTLNLRVVN
jgi:uncharacterized protein (TIGR03437 family)